MRYQKSSDMVTFVILCSLVWTVGGNHLKFPDGFQFGVATASYQIEGGWNEDGKGENIWDHFVHDKPNRIVDKTNGDVACDSYHKLQDDIDNLKWLGVDFYRFSLSWSRILPSGYANKINEEGVRYYNQLIDKLLENNIEPMVTLYHWDLPQPLHEIGGFPNILLADYYEDYARVVFKLFGDRVKLWITFNEPPLICQAGYAEGYNIPGYMSDGIGGYLCGRTLLIAHARAYRMYRKEFYDVQKGQVGITINGNWYEPATNFTEDKEAAERSLWMNFGWWTHPIFSKTGDYPPIMKQRIDEMSKQENFPRSRLILFTPQEITLIQGTSDFFGLNHYTTRLTISDTTGVKWNTPSLAKDVGVKNYPDPSWANSSAPWLQKVPWGFRKLVKWIKDQYDPVIYITENGWADHPGELHDQGRIDYHHDYLEALLVAINVDGCNVKGYAAWSLMDNFEWFVGFTQRFGLFYVNITTPDRTRTAKDSAYYYKDLIQKRMIDRSPLPIVKKN